jgi:signal transduction histidine kinase/integral membrane sensor domain MASE1
MSNKKLPYAALVAGVAVLYFASGQLGLKLAGSGPLSTPIWPPAGIALAIVLMAGYWVWPGLALGAFAVALTFVPAPKGHAFALIGASLGIALGNTLQAVEAAWLIERFANGRQAFAKPQTIFKFAALVALVAAAAVALNLGAVEVFGLLGGQNSGVLWLSWWQAHMVSIIILTPLVLLCSTPEVFSDCRRLFSRRLGEAVLLLLLLLALSWIGFGGWFSAYTQSVPLGFLVIPVLLWAALRFGQRGTAAVALLVAALATTETLRGNGPFALPNRTTALLLLQNFLAVITVMSLVLAADVAHRRQVEAGLRASENRYRALSELGRKLSAARTHKDAARSILDAALDLFGWDSCTFDLLEPDQVTTRAVLYIDTLEGRRQEIPPQNLLQKAGAHTRHVLENGPTLNLRSLPLHFPADTLPFGDKARPSASLMYVPVVKDDKIIAILSIQSYTPNAYTQQDLRIFQTLADHSGAALERIRAEQEIERLNRELRQHLDELSRSINDRNKAEQEILRLNSELERRVRDRTAQLEAINKELEAFSYSVSHDLRAPLRSIRGFADILLHRHASKLDSSGQEFLRRACQSCAQMSELIEDLLHLSRVGRSELHCRNVNLSRLAESVAEELRGAEPRRPVKFTAAPRLEAWGDERLLRLVLENLLRNAWKFTSKTSKPRIEFGRADGPAPAFFVRDNGAGFDMAHSDKLFGVFQRLHSDREFPGTGVGLATVQRIINRHAGRVWAEGAVNQGATIYFTLPSDEND